MMRITLRSALWFLATVCLSIVSFWMVNADEPKAEKRTTDDQKEAAKPRLSSPSSTNLSIERNR